MPNYHNTKRKDGKLLYLSYEIHVNLVLKTDSQNQKENNLTKIRNVKILHKMLIYIIHQWIKIMIQSIWLNMAD